MERYYPENGAKYTNSKEQKDQLNEAITKLQWTDLANSTTFPPSLQCALQEKIRDLKAQVDRIAYCEGLFGRYRMIALRDNYAKGDVRRATLYMLEIGDTFITLAVDKEKCYSNLIMVTNAFDEGDNVLYFTVLTQQEIHKSLKVSGVHFDDIYTIKQEEAQFYCYEPHYCSLSLENQILENAAKYDPVLHGSIE